MSDNTTSHNDKQGIKSLSKALRILECFVDHNQELTLVQIMKILGYPKTTVYGILQTLKAEGYLEQNNEMHTYRLGTKFLDLGYATKKSLSVGYLFAPKLDKICSRTQMNTYLTTHRDGKLLFLESCYHDREYISYSTAGKTLPLHCTGAGKAMMSFMTEAQVDAVIRKYGLFQKTPNTITDAGLLKKELASIRERGFSVDDEEEKVGIKCVAVALLNSDSVPVGAISVSGSAITMTVSKTYEFGTFINQQCRLMSEHFEKFPFRFLPSGQE